MSTSEKKKLSIISFSGDFDKLVAAFTLASGSAALNYDVNIFFTFWGLNAIKIKKGRRFTGKGILAKTFGMRKRNVATLKELIEAAIALNVNLYACEMSMHILGITKEDFIPEIKEVIGVASFLQYSEGGDRIFI
jgi:peroxiredoxin family protein